MRKSGEERRYRFISGSNAILALSVFALALAACAEPKITRRWETRLDTLPTGAASPTGTVSAFTLDPESSSSGKTIFDMSGEGQAAFISAVSPSGNLSAGDLRQALSKKIADPSKPTTDFSMIRRRLVVDIQRRSDGEADRFLRTTTTVSFADASLAEFTGFEKFATRYETVDLGSLKFDQKSNLTAEASIDPGGSHVTGINLTGSYETALSEQVVLKRRIASINPHFAPDQIQIDQEGEIGRDLVGNQVIDLTVRIKSLQQDWVSQLDGFDASKSADDAQVSVTRIKIPANGCQDVNASVSLTGVVRMVTQGQETFTESDDTVFYAYVTASTPNPVLLVPQSTLRRSAWELRNPRTPAESVKILDDNGQFTPLRLTSYDQAKSVLGWLKQNQSATLGKRTLEIGGIQKADDAAGYAAAIQRLAVWINKLNWASCG